MVTNYTYDAYETTIARVDTNADNSARFWNGYSDGPGRTSFRNFRWDAIANGWDANNFTITEVGACTQTLSDADDGGAVIFLNSAADNDGQNIRVGKGTDGTGGAAITHKSNKLIFMEATIKLSEATQNDFYFGIYNKSTDAVGTIPTSGFFFRKDDGDTQLDIVCVATGPGDTTQTVNVKTMDTGFHKYGIKITGGAKAEFYVDDLLIGTISTLTSFPASTVFMAPQFAHQNGDAVARTMTMKDLYVAAQL